MANDCKSSLKFLPSVCLPKNFRISIPEDCRFNTVLTKELDDQDETDRLRRLQHGSPFGAPLCLGFADDLKECFCRIILLHLALVGFNY